MAHDEEEAIKLQTASNNIVETVLNNGLCASLKYIITEMGIDVGKVRNPFLPLREEQEKKISEVVHQYLTIR